MCQSRNDCGYKPKGAAASSAKMFRDGTFFFSLQKRRQLFLRVENCSVLTKPFTRRGCIAFVSDRSTMFYKGMNSNVHPEEFGTQPWRRIIEELPAAIRRKMGIFPFFSITWTTYPSWLKKKWPSLFLQDIPQQLHFPFTPPTLESVRYEMEQPTFSLFLIHVLRIKESGVSDSWFEKRIKYFTTPSNAFLANATWPQCSF